MDRPEYRVMAHRSGNSVFGAATSPLKGADGQPVVGEYADCRARADALNSSATSPNVWYTVEINPA